MVLAQFTETREITKRFKVTPDTRIELSNKYGKIDLKTWDKDSVVVDIDISVEDKKLSKLNKSLDNIDFNITSNQNLLIVRTLASENLGALEKEFQKLKETVFQSSGNIEINFTVWLPNTNNLKIENKFGDVSIDDYKGEIEIDLSNGNLKAQDFNGNANITLSFADASINQMKSGTLNCNYGELELKKADQLQISSKSTTFEIDEITNLKTDSRRDKFRIRQAENIEASGSFSSFRLDKLVDRATMRIEYGDIEINKIEPDFTSIYIESKSTDIELNFNESSEFNFEITNLKTDTHFSDEMNVTDKEIVDDKDGKVKLTGSFGSGATREKLNINAVGGEIGIYTE